MTRDEAIASASACFADGLILSDSMSVRDAVDAAVRPGGPPREEVERLIRERRARIAATQTPAASTLPDARQVAAHPEPQPVPSPNPVRSAAGRAPRRKSA